MDMKIVDVAKRAGVSPATVSRVLNDSSLVKERTKAKVLAAIKEMDYHPNSAAKHLRSQRTMMLGVIVPDINVSYFAEIIKGIENMAYARKYKVIICDSDNKAEKEQEYLALLPNRAVDAMILVTPLIDNAILYEYADKGHTIGIIGKTVTHERIPSCKTDNVKFSYQVVDHLIEQGHEQIAYIGGYPDSVETYERLEGYMKALKEHHIPFRPGLIDNGDFEEEGGYAALLRLLDAKTPITAVYVANDEMALGVYKACREKGIRIPEDLAVVGVDNNRITKYLLPPLSTVEQPKYTMGAIMAEKLIDRLTDNEFEDKHHFVIDSEVIIRESSVRKA
ncbi:LacI family DNA-binding transcriptional regulator [Paenibacillus radicis (ex Gao et al. 2016)]|uniref:Catabolite control protein A n=1 Tax=Paenibacillus radicis (ex Gao et al. 2016) TaxID=1737354 RepID=A0A917LZX6_9BACL|nr:LacI family DNA-binding transcriptional regulator [Paenibacillus radicis (ex Gao et al. 2016)]GGG66857.1 catabolite control protein A [Paenibacillus radicis (ex Gao et al. 2016)]